MKKFTLISIVLLFLISSCDQNNKQAQPTVLKSESKAINIQELGQRLYTTDSFYKRSRKTRIVFVKVAGKEQPVRIIDGKYPANITATFYILTDNSGRVLRISEAVLKVIEGWYVSYTHYFDEKGNTYAFRRQTNFFKSKCTKGVAYETKIEYYDAHLKQIGTDYKIVDEKKKPLQKDVCDFPYDFDYKVYENLDTYLNTIHIKLN